MGWRHNPLLWMALFMIGGIAAGHLCSLPVSAGASLAATAGLTVASWLAGFIKKNPKSNVLAKTQSWLVFASFFMLGLTVTICRDSRQTTQWPDGEITMEAVLTSEPVVRGRTLVFDAIVTRASADAHLPALVKLKVMADARSKRLKVGDGVVVRSSIVPIGSGFQRKSHFDYRSFMEGRGYSGETFAHRFAWQKRRVSLRSLSLIERTRLRLATLRHSLLERYRQFRFDDDQLAVLAAMTLGDKSAIDRNLKESYAVSGAAHILALSGMHLGIIYIILTKLFRSGRNGRNVVRQLVILCCIWIYTLMVGMSPSVVRAAVMITIMVVVYVSGRNPMSLSSLAFAAIVMLVANPALLFDISFQMSFAAVAAILIFNPPLYELLPPPLLFRFSALKWLWGLATVSIAAQIGVAPLVAFYFNRFSTYFLLANFVVIPCATMILYGAAVLFLLPPLAHALSVVLVWLTAIVNRYVAWVASLPGASIEGIHLSAVQVLLIYAIALCLLALYKKIKNLKSRAI